jgi:TonB family protein
VSDLASRIRQHQGSAVGLAATVAIHLLVVGLLFLGSRSESKPRRTGPEEVIVTAQVVEIQAGSAEGMREKGPAFKRKPRRGMATDPMDGPTRAAGRHALGMATGMEPLQMDRPPADDKDDAANPDGVGDSQAGVDAMGAGAGDDRHGAGGTADRGALDPCFTEHAAVVASYQAQVAAKIPRFKRPAFIPADVAANLSAAIRVSIDAAGKIVGTSVGRSSGNPQYDDAAKAHVAAVGSFPAPHRCVMYSRETTRFQSARSFTVVIKP